VEVSDEALGVTPGRTASSADLGGKFQISMVQKRIYANSFTGSSKYSNENFED
jgi:hypothetical protein